MTQTEKHLEQLFEALLILRQMNVKELLDNQTLTKEIKEVVSGKNLQAIMGSLWRDRQLEEQQKIHQQSGVTNDVKSQSEELLMPYVKYQSAAFNKLAGRKETTPRITELVTRDSVKAFNAKARKQNLMTDDSIASMKETKEFAEVFNSVKDAGTFNSIYSDRALQINTDRDPTVMSSYIDYSPYTVNYLYYLGIPTLDQTIDFPIAMATRDLPEINFDDEELTEQFALFYKRSGLQDKIRRLLFYSSMSPRGSLIVPIKEKGRIRFNVFNDTQFTYATSQQYSAIDFDDTSAGVSQLFCLGHLLQNEVTAHFLCPGFEPIYAIGKNRIYRLKEAAEAINLYLYTIKVLCVRAQVIVQKWAGQGLNDTKLAQMQKLVTRINSELSMSTAVEIPEDADLQILNNNLSPGFADVQPIIKEFQGMVTGVMPDYFYGSDTAYAANSFNLNVTHQNIKSQMQIAQIQPALRFIINTVLEQDERFEKYRKEVDNYDIEFDSLYQQTDQEKAELDSKKIDNMIKMATNSELKDAFIAEGLWREDQELPDLLDEFKKETGQLVDEQIDEAERDDRFKGKVGKEFDNPLGT